MHKCRKLAFFPAMLIMAFSCSEPYPPIDRLTAEDLAAQKLTKDKISGVSQKGPFIINASVVVQELNSKLEQTGGSFRGAITDGRGSFEIKSVELASPYAMLEIQDYYYNEVSGERDGPIKLYAIADLKEKNSVNVNILTHLEYHRVLNLAKTGAELAEAKSRAQREILDFFGISGSFSGSEDMSIFGMSDNSSALLAVSVLLQGSLAPAEFSELLAELSLAVSLGDIARGNAVKKKIADWVSGADLGRIRDNVEGWGFSDVPDFEKYVRRFWSGYYRLGDCNPAVEGSSKENSNSSSDKYGSGYVCNGSYWVPSSGASGKCNGQSYSPDTHFCFSGGIFPKCEGQEYNPFIADCELGVLRKQCGSGGKYIVSFQFCFNETKYDKCGGVLEYNPTMEFCFGDNVYGKCGGNDYSPSTHFCLGSTVAPLCGGKPFTGAQFCHNGKVENKCGTRTETFDPDLYRCVDNGKIYLATPVSYGGENYNAVLIGTQTWMAKNLNYNVSGSACYGNDPANCSTYGRLYNWDAAMIACPTGWHLPSQNESNMLTAAVGGNTDGRKLKAKDGWTNCGPSGSGKPYVCEDAYGFSALPGGFLTFPGSDRLDFSVNGNYVGLMCYFWVSSETSSNTAYNWAIDYNTEYTRWINDLKGYLRSVRCIRD